jgi:hypothetical protein
MPLLHGLYNAVSVASTGSAASVAADLAAHAALTNNPHAVTASQAGALAAAPVTILHTTGLRTTYLAASDTDASRGTALMQALTVAVSGESVDITADCSVTGNLLKNGITYNLAPGIVITALANGNYSLFSDTSGACVCTIDGAADLIHNDGFLGHTIDITNANSSVRFNVDKIKNLHSTPAAAANTINQAAGNVDITCRYLSCNNTKIIKYDGGTANIYAREVHLLGSDVNASAIFATSGGTAGVLRVQGSLIKAHGAGLLFWPANDKTRMVIDFTTIETQTGSICWNNGGDISLRADVVRAIAPFHDLIPAYWDTDGGDVYMDIGTVYTQNASVPWYGHFGNATIMHINRIVDTGGMPSGGFIYSGGGSDNSPCYFTGDSAEFVTPNKDFCFGTGGHIVVGNVKVRTTGTGMAFRQGGGDGTITIKPTVNYLTSQTTGTLTFDMWNMIPSAQGLKVLASANATRKSFELVPFGPVTDNVAGSGKAYFHVPSTMNGQNVVLVHALVQASGTTGDLSVNVSRTRSGTTVPMMSGTAYVKVATLKHGSDEAGGSSGTINTSNDDLATNDILRVDVITIHTTPAKGLIVTVEAETP